MKVGDLVDIGVPSIKGYGIIVEVGDWLGGRDVKVQFFAKSMPMPMTWRSKYLRVISEA